MNWYKIAQENTHTNVYRTCVLRNNPENGQLEVKSLYQPDLTTPISVGSVLQGSFYAGTKAKFCLGYYTGMTDLEEGETEVLLTLRVPIDSVPSPETDSFMGGEVVVENPVVVKIENTEDIMDKPEYQ
jgi:hypothetical protein